MRRAAVPGRAARARLPASRACTGQPHRTPQQYAALPVNFSYPVNFSPDVKERQHIRLFFTGCEKFTGKQAQGRLVVAPDVTAGAEGTADYGQPRLEAADAGSGAQARCSASWNRGSNAGRRR